MICIDMRSNLKWYGLTVVWVLDFLEAKKEEPASLREKQFEVNFYDDACLLIPKEGQKEANCFILHVFSCLVAHCVASRYCLCGK